MDIKITKSKIIPLISRRFEFIDENDYKFWEIKVSQNQIDRRFGKIGFKGRVHSRKYPDCNTAIKIAEKMVGEKLIDGYQEVLAGQSDKILLRSLARLEKKETNPLVKKAIRIYAHTSSIFCEPQFCEFDPNNLEHRFSDQILGGFPYTSKDNPWPKNNNGSEMQFLAQIDLSKASQLIREDFGSGLLQVWAPFTDCCDEILLRVISKKDLADTLDTHYPKDMKYANRNGIFNVVSMRVKSPKVDWKPAQSMFYPNIWSRICGCEESVDVIYKEDVSDTLLDMIDDHNCARGINRPTFYGLQGKRCPNIYLGGYPFSEGNGWNFHNPLNRSLLNMWLDDGILWHLCVWKNSDGVLVADVNCTR